MGTWELSVKTIRSHLDTSEISRQCVNGGTQRRAVPGFNENIKYLIRLSGNRTHKLHVHSHTLVHPAPRRSQQNSYAKKAIFYEDTHFFL